MLIAWFTMFEKVPITACWEPTYGICGYCFLINWDGCIPIIEIGVGYWGMLGWAGFGCNVFWLIAILVTFVLCLASMSCFESMSIWTICYCACCSFFSSLTRSAYLRVFRVCSQQEFAGDTFAIIVVLLSPVNESFNTYVSLLPLKGVCFFSRSSALMHSFNASRLLLISAPSSLVCLF